MSKRTTNKEIKDKLEKIEKKLDIEFFNIYNRDKIARANTIAYALITVAAFSVSAFFPTRDIKFIWFGLFILGTGFVFEGRK